MQSMDIADAYLIPGWCYPTELDALKILLEGSSCHIEIGAFCGKSLYASCIDLSPNATVYVVDPCDYVSDLKVPGNNWVKSVLDTTIDSVISKRPDLQITHLQTESLLAANYIREKNVQPTSVYIDGQHHYAEVKQDIKLWYSLLEYGGRILGHDYWAANPGVIDAVEELFEGTAKLFKNTRIWYADKPSLAMSHNIPYPLSNKLVS